MGNFLDSYQPVEDRLREFWERHPMGRITTELLSHENGRYIVQASVWLGDELREGRPGATGLASDSVDTLPANMKASALEVCETSAIGRALANLGFAPKGKRPSREEMSKTSPGVPVTRAGGPGVPAPGDDPSLSKFQGAPTSPAPTSGTDSAGGASRGSSTGGAPESDHAREVAGSTPAPGSRPTPAVAGDNQSEAVGSTVPASPAVSDATASEEVPELRGEGGDGTSSLVTFESLVKVLGNRADSVKLINTTVGSEYNARTVLAATEAELQAAMAQHYANQEFLKEDA